MKLKSIIELRNIFRSHKADVYPVPLALKIIKFLKATETDAQFYTESMKPIAERYLQKDGKGNYVPTSGGYLIAKGKENEYFSEVSELEGAETDVKISFSLAEVVEMKLTLEELTTISEFLEGENG